MKLTIVRSIPIVGVASLALFALSGVPRFKNAHHGLDYIIGEIVWLGFLIAALAAVVLSAVAIYRRKTPSHATAARN
ncbi:MAG: hypothetical protein ACRDLK_03990 [Gaiellaceae bacterium]